jgi:hypothetical protein
MISAMIPLEFRKKQDIERLPAIMKCLAQFDLSGARDRNRTGTSLSGPGILSPVRLPVSPPGRDKNFHYHGIKLPQPPWGAFGKASRREH